MAESTAKASPIRAIIVPVTPLQQNCTLVWCVKTLKAAVIDPGGDAPRLIKAAADRGLTIDRIWITHGHLDHVGAAADLQDAADVPIEGPHPADQFWIDNVEAAAAQWGMPGARGFTPDRWLDEGDDVLLGETRFAVRHCPGHTPGHVIFFNAEARFAQVGDVLFKGSVGRTDFPQSSHEQLLRSVVDKLWPLGEDVSFVPGHGAMSTFGAERATNPFVGDAALRGAAF